MEITITINGKPVQATVDDAVIREAMGEKTSEKMTGYERNEGGSYYVVEIAGGVHTTNDEMCEDDERYKAGNYYSDLIVARNNARADRLMRNLRRFAAEHGGCSKPRFAAKASAVEHDWSIRCAEGYIQAMKSFPSIGQIFFKDEETANAAIEAFRDELTWYFTEYDPMPEGWWDS